MKESIRVGVIGLGFMGRAHVAHYEKMPNATVVAVADADPHRRQGGADVAGNIAVPLAPLDVSRYQVFADGRDLVEKADVDLVDICLPTYLHADFAVAAANAGKHVAVEKPMALSSAEAERMIAAARAKHVELMVAHCLRFWPEYVYLKELIDTKRFGKLVKAEFLRRSSKPIWTWQGWMTDAKRSGGAMLDLHIHDVDYVNYVLGRPKHLYARAIRTDATGGYDLVTSQYSYEGGPEITLDAAWYQVATYGFRATFLALFEGALVRMDSSAQPSLHLHQVGSAQPEVIELKGDAYYSELAFLVDCLLTGKSPATVIPPESARQSIELVEAEQRSSETGQVLSF